MIMTMVMMKILLMMILLIFIIFPNMIGEEQKKGIELANSFTFDLIALNKAARIQDKKEAQLRVVQIQHDLEEFLKLKPL